MDEPSKDKPSESASNILGTKISNNSPNKGSETQKDKNSNSEKEEKKSEAKENLEQPKADNQDMEKEEPEKESSEEETPAFKIRPISLTRIKDKPFDNFEDKLYFEEKKAQESKKNTEDKNSLTESYKDEYQDKFENISPYSPKNDREMGKFL